ncbi:lysosomal acid phosphatase-like [Brachionus plicatilis]|uniref:Lysosomal acid phosphatase-like n=1 Tax=Brachionus plicatilis TaxID=10195 RepID=A0A3M7T329_BRAPC|nr:lysosomal acid phosphatase-like [Brachionus plicatilis]
MSSSVTILENQFNDTAEDAEALPKYKRSVGKVFEYLQEYPLTTFTNSNMHIYLFIFLTIKSVTCFNLTDSSLEQIYMFTNQQRGSDNEVISKILCSKFRNSCPYFDQFTPLTIPDLINLRLLGNFLNSTYDLKMPPLRSQTIRIYHSKNENFNISAYKIFSQIYGNQTRKLKETLFFKNLEFPVGSLEYKVMDCYINIKLESENYLRLNLEKQEFLRNVSIESGQNFLDYLNFSMFSNQILNRKCFNKTLPTWAENNLQEVLSGQTYYFKFFFGDRNIAKILSGNLFEHMLQRLRDFRSETVIYLTDDARLCSLLTSLESPCNFKPEIGSSLIFEIRKSARKRFVRVLFLNITENFELKTKEIQFRGCDQFCPLSIFLQAIDKTTGFDPEFEFMIIKKPTTLDHYLSVSQKVFGLLFLSAMIVILILQFMETVFFYFIFVK